MAIEIHLPRKYSRATLEMLRNNDGPNVVMTPGAVETTIEEFTDKAGQPVTKQSVLDIFNKQVIERTNHIPKYSRDYYFVPMGNFGGWHDNGMHAGLVNMLGNAYLSNEYGFMCMHDYLKLSDFKDKEGDITIDDLSNTFSETINKLGTLSKLKITIKKGNRVFSESTHYAIGNGSTPSNLIDYNEVKNRIINSDDFNGVCKKWFARIVDNSRNNPINYEVRLPDPVVNDIKYYLNEPYFGRPGEDSHETYGTNRVQIRTFFGEAEKGLYFKLPKVTRNLKGFSVALDRRGGNHRHELLFSNIIVLNERTNVIVGGAPGRSLGGGDGNHTFMFSNPILLTESGYDDLILKITVKTHGDSGDVSWINFTINELIWSDDFNTDPIGTLESVPLEVINREIIYNDRDEQHLVINKLGTIYRFKYIVKGFTRKIHHIYHELTNSGHLRTVGDGIEVRRNGVLIGTSSNNTLKSRGQGNSKWHRHYNWNYSPVVRSNLSHLDIKNGDELTFVFIIGNMAIDPDNNPVNSPYYRNPELYIRLAREANRRLIVKQVYYKAETISR